MAFGSPFGLAYGLGAGLANVPQAYTTGIDQQQAYAMRQLGLEQQRGEAEQQKQMDQALSQPLDASRVPKETVANPEFQKQQGAAMGFRQSAQLAQDEFGGIGGDPNQIQEPPPEPTAAPTVNQDIDLKEYPYLAHKLQLEQAADRVASLGRGRASMAIRQQALEFENMHRQQSLKLASDAFAFGSPSAAIKPLNSLGYGIKQIVEDPDDDSKYLVTRIVDGKEVEASVPKVLATAIGNPQAGSLLATLNWRERVGDQKDRTLATQEQRANAYSKRVADQAKYQEGMLEIRKHMKDAPTAMMKNAKDYQEKTGCTAKEAAELFAPKDKSAVNPIAFANALRLANASIEKSYNDAAPEKPSVKLDESGNPIFKGDNDPKKLQWDDYTRYYANKKMMGETLSNAHAKLTQPKTPGPSRASTTLPPPESRPNGYPGALKDGTPVWWDATNKTWSKAEIKGQ